MTAPTIQTQPRAVFDTPTICMECSGKIPGGRMRPEATKALSIIFLLCGVAIPMALTAQTQTTAKDPIAVQFTATSENVSGAGEPIKINVFNWSSDADRDQMVAAWTLTTAP